jgi:hypothetical protein
VIRFEGTFGALDLAFDPRDAFLGFDGGTGSVDVVEPSMIRTPGI